VQQPANRVEPILTMAVIDSGDAPATAVLARRPAAYGDVRIAFLLSALLRAIYSQSRQMLQNRHSGRND
jgi:hypothetical protein